jgi:lipopolysaccharide/colanic/teichoic acid biosynthesis glycosyltransferase
LICREEVFGVRVHSPSSHARISVRLSPLDVAVAALAPILALNLRHAILWPDAVDSSVVSYCLASFSFSLIAFAAFRIHGGIPRYLSLRDLVDLTFAVVAAELMTCVALFTFTRLEGIPRSVPAIHMLILGAGLLGVRALVRLLDVRRAGTGTDGAAPRHVIVVGLNDLSVLFLKFLEAAGPGGRKVVAVLDDERRWYGRSVNGVRVYGPPSQLDALIGEFGTHGVEIDEVLIGVDEGQLPAGVIEEMRRVCAARNVELAFVPAFLTPGLRQDQEHGCAGTAPSHVVQAAVATAPYFRIKRAIDIVAALGLMVVLAPLWALAALIAFLDVGSPILFWQQRTGLGGRAFHLYKVRTLRPIYGRGGAVSEEDRLSRAGRFLRRARLDELPQLLNVLAGEMSLVGPRPLLPQDQPNDPLVRLSVRPGITGWAQVNGGVLLTPEEKDALDSWYIANASLGLDLRVVGLTVRSLFKGDRRPAQPLDRARPAAERPIGRTPVVTTRFTPSPSAEPALSADRQSSVARSL